MEILKRIKEKLPGVYNIYRKYSGNYLKPIRNILDLRYNERRVSYGKENPDLQFFVVRRSDVDVALGGLVNSYVLGGIRHAADIGAIPVVDLMSCRTF